MTSTTQTLWEAVEEIQCELEERGVELSITAHEDLQAPYQNGMRYGEVVRSDVPVETIKGKRTRKYAHAVIERLDSGRYEPLVYVL